jgi:hypothetical protein
MSDDTEQDGPAAREHYRVVIRQLFVEDEWKWHKQRHL